MINFNRIGLGAGVLGLLSLCSIAHAAMPPNSYLVKTVNSVDEMIAQIRANDTVRDRYERHFHMTAEEVLSYVRGLHLARTSRDGDFLVYNVPAETGMLRSRVLHLKKGTKVWADFSGQPVLQWICGNPMTRGPKRPATMNDTGEVVMVPNENLMQMETNLAPKMEDVPVYVANSQPMDVAPDNVPTVAEHTDVPSVPKSKDSGLAALALLPLGLLAIHHDNPKTPNPVPEPTSLVILATGAVAMARSRRK